MFQHLLLAVALSVGVLHFVNHHQQRHSPLVEAVVNHLVELDRRGVPDAEQVGDVLRQRGTADALGAVGHHQDGAPPKTRVLDLGRHPI